jgi:NADH-quinone oxidoreductase subunit F
VNFDEIQKKAVAEWEALEKGDKPHIIVGTATCGRAAGALAVIEAINSELAKHKIEANITQVGCIGMCYAEPLVEIVKPNRPHIFYGNITPQTVPQLIEGYLINDDMLPDLALGTSGNGSISDIPNFWDLPMLKPQVRVALRNCGIIDPEKINHYIARGGYSGIVKALKMTPQEVLDEIKKSGLRGRGGAGFPTGTKWQLLRDASGEIKYLICNADEGDPGAFMDRSLLEGDPHSVLEGMLIGAYATGATESYIYCRAEYPLAIARLETALRQMAEYNLIGDNILGSNFSFHIKIKEGAGAFVCGEETALMASIEGKRGMPRSRPPFPATSGLWGKPTNINNVETWANASAILQHDGEWYASYGTEKSKGTKTFALAGKINHTGLIEVPMGIPLHEIIYEIGGGILSNKTFKAVQTGGPSGGCLPTEQLELPVEYESLAQAGAIMGSGGMVVMDEETCMVDVARYFLSFTQAESCGKCVPCRIGTKQMLDILERICRGEGRMEDIDLLETLGTQIKAGSLCQLGQTAPNPVLTTLRYFKDEYIAHIQEKRCPALSCTKLISFYILPDKCQGCGICARECPAEAIVGGKRMVHIIDQDKCIKCGTCLEVCPTKFDAIVKVSGETVEVPKEPIPVTAEKPKATTT